MLYDNGILMTNGFAIASAKPADLKFIADTLEDRDSFTINNLAYEGMLVYVKETKKTYQYIDSTWNEFGFNQEKFESQITDNLLSTSSTTALSARQGKVLNDKITTHSNDAVKHITANERTTWNAKANNTLVTTSLDGLMRAIDKTKLDGIEEGANNYVHPAAHVATMITQDTTHRFVSDTEKASWNGKADNTLVTTASDGLMRAIDKTKLDGIEEGANNYVHPSTHPASIITQDTTHRFVTDTQINNWNNKPSTEIATTTNHGLMSKEDKVKLNGIATGANNYTHPSSHPASIITQDTTHRFVTDTQINNWNNIAGTIKVVTTTENGLMLATDKVKLNGIEEFANKYVHPSSHPATMITQDATHRFVTDTEKSTWNNIISTIKVVTTTENGLMSKEDKVKLNGIATGANNYTHPSSHPASIISQDATHRFITDSERAAWNAKASTAIATQTTNGLMSSSDKTNLDNLLNRMTQMEQQQATMLAKLKTAVFLS